MRLDTGLGIRCVAAIAVAVVLSISGGALVAQGTIVAVGEEWAYFKGTEEPPADWNQLAFDDSEWLRGPTGIGYADGDDATVLDDMQGVYASVFARRVFELEVSPDDVGVLALGIDYDDGFVAYLNGQEIARDRVDGAPPAFDALATSGHEANGVVFFPIVDFVDFLEEGVNVLAIQVHNTTLNSSDLSLIPELVADPLLCPIDIDCRFEASTGEVTIDWTSQAIYESIEITRDGATLVEIAGDAESFVDDTPPVGSVSYGVIALAAGQVCDPITCAVEVFSSSDVVIAPGDEWLIFKGSEVFPVDWTSADFDDGAWTPAVTGIGYGDNDDATILDDMRNNYLSVLARTTFHIESAAAVESALLSVLYDDGVVFHLNGTEIGRANMPATEITNITTASAAGEPTTVVFPVDPALLVDGPNVLAASVHNANLTSSDLSFIPTLIVTASDEPPPGGEPTFRRGDANDDGSVNLTDAITILGALFQGQAFPVCPDAGDCNDDGTMNLSDPVYVLAELFQGGPPLPAPGKAACGIDPTPDTHARCETTVCDPVPPAPAE